MKKLLSSVSKSALILCLTLQFAHAMDGEKGKGFKRTYNQAFPDTNTSNEDGNNRIVQNRTIEQPAEPTLPQEITHHQVLSSAHTTNIDEENNNFGIVQGTPGQVKTLWLPPEVWDLIIYWTLRFEIKALNLVPTSLAYVSQSWNKRIQKFFIHPAVLTRMSDADMQKHDFILSSLKWHDSTKKIYNHDLEKNFTKLVGLDLSKNTRVTNAGIEGLTNLMALRLSYTPHVTNSGIKSLTNLTTLSLSGNIKITDDGIISLTNLTTLDVANSKITKKGIKGRTNLTTLILGCNQNATDEWLSGLINLTTLDVNDNITDKGIKGLTRLTTLRLGSHQGVTNNGVKYLTNLTHLGLMHHMNITGDVIKLLPKLKILDLRGNQVVTDDMIKDLTNLTVLRINQYPTCPSYTGKITWLGLRKLTNLTDLEIYRKDLGPAFIQQCRQDSFNWHFQGTQERDRIAQQQRFFNALQSLLRLFQDFPERVTETDRANYGISYNAFNRSANTQ